MDEVEVCQVILQNSIKLELLLRKGTECLREMFKKEVEAATKHPWGNSYSDGHKFLDVHEETLRQKYNWTTHFPQYNKLASGKVDEWDMALLIKLIKLFPSTLPNISTIQRDNYLDILAKERNHLAHLGKDDITFYEFQQRWKRIVSIFVKFGVPAEQLKKKVVLGIVETKTNRVNEQPRQTTETEKLTNYRNSISTKTAVDDHTATLRALKDTCKMCFQHKLYDTAIRKYTEAISIPDLRSSDVASLYLDRAICYVKLKYFGAAKHDAKLAVSLQPSSVGYCTLAVAYVGLSKLSKALENYEEALKLNPENTQIRQHRDETKFQLHLHLRELAAVEAPRHGTDPTVLEAYAADESILREATAITFRENQGTHHHQETDIEDAFNLNPENSQNQQHHDETKFFLHAHLRELAAIEAAQRATVEIPPAAYAPESRLREATAITVRENQETHGHHHQQIDEEVSVEYRKARCCLIL